MTKPRILGGYSPPTQGLSPGKNCNKKVGFKTVLLFPFFFFFFFCLATSILVFVICNQVAILYSICLASRLLLMKVMSIFLISMILI